MQKQLAQSYTPPQEFKNIYSPECSLQHGTIFGELHLAAGTEGKKIKVQKEEEALLKLTELGFAVLDLQLYLNVYPTDLDAIKTYNSTVDCYNKAKTELEKQNGPLRNFTEPSQTTKFNYIHSPWPWD